MSDWQWKQIEKINEDAPRRAKEASEEALRNAGCLMTLWLMVAHFAPATFAIYLLPPVLALAVSLGRSFGLHWFYSLPNGTIALTPFTESQVVPAIFHTLGLGFMAAVVLVLVLSIPASIGFGFWKGTWITRIASTWYVYSLAFWGYYSFNSIPNKQPMANTFWGCFATSLVAELGWSIWKKLAGKTDD